MMRMTLTGWAEAAACGDVVRAVTEQGIGEGRTYVGQAASAQLDPMELTFQESVSILLVTAWCETLPQATLNESR